MQLDNKRNGWNREDRRASWHKRFPTLVLSFRLLSEQEGKFFHFDDSSFSVSIHLADAQVTYSSTIMVLSWGELATFRFLVQSYSATPNHPLNTLNHIKTLKSAFTAHTQKAAVLPLWRWTKCTGRDALTYGKETLKGQAGCCLVAQSTLPLLVDVVTTRMCGRMWHVYTDQLKKKFKPKHKYIPGCPAFSWGTQTPALPLSICSVSPCWSPLQPPPAYGA